MFPILFKLLPKIFLLQEVADAYAEAKKENKPFYLSRRFWGAVLTIVGAVVTVASGVAIDANVLDAIAGNTQALVGAGVTLYGVIMGIVGQFMKKPVAPVTAQNQ